MNRQSAVRGVAALVSGILFGAGLLVSGMTRPQKVIGFLDWFGAWDPSLALVMVGAIGVHLVAYRWIRGRPSPLLSQKWAVPRRSDIDFKLMAGAALFGAGWGLGGYCPGPAVVSLASGGLPVIVFVLSMLAGTRIAARLERRAAQHGGLGPFAERGSSQGARREPVQDASA